MVWFYVALALCGGSCLPIQAGVNATLSRFVRSPFSAAFISFSVGALSSLLGILLTRAQWRAFSALSSAPWWVWIGGALGAVYVTAALTVAPRLGAVTLVALAVTGQLAASVLLDHFGLVGFPIHRFNALRAAGILLLICGVILVRKF